MIFFGPSIRSHGRASLEDRLANATTLKSLTPLPVAARNGGSGMFIVVDGLDELHELVSRRTSLVMPLTKQFYGMREFAVTDPDGHLITFAEPYEQ